MLKAVKIRLIPTKEQEVLFWKSVGTARWAYNFYIFERERVYQEWKDNGNKGKKTISESAVRKYINNVLKPTTHLWLSEVGSNVMKQAVKDCNDAYNKWYDKQKELKRSKNYDPQTDWKIGKPKFKKKGKSKPNFYVNYESLSRKDGGFHGEKIGYVKTATPLPKLKKGQKYSNPRISYDGKNWYLSVGYNFDPEKQELSGESIGIDLGIKDLAIVSDGSKFKNINKTKEVRRLEKKLKRKQRSLSRMELENTDHYIKDAKGYDHPVWKRPLRECANHNRQSKKIALIQKRLADIRQNHIHQTTAAIVKTKPSRIVVENLNVSGMMKNKHLSKAVANEKFYEFIRQMKYKCEWNGIELVQADRYFPSSKMCSCCGNIKKDLKLSDRTYKCKKCGITIDRDFNASLNLAKYEIA